MGEGMFLLEKALEHLQWFEDTDEWLEVGGSVTVAYDAIQDAIWTIRELEEKRDFV